MPSIPTKTFVQAVEEGLIKLPKITVARDKLSLSKSAKINRSGEPDTGSTLVPKYSKAESAVQNTENVADEASALAFKAYVGELAARKAVPAIASALGKSVPAIVPKAANVFATTGRVMGTASQVPAILWGVDAVRSVADPELVKRTKEATLQQIEAASEPDNYLSSLGSVVSSAAQRPASTFQSLLENISDANLEKHQAEEEIKLRRNALALAQRQVLRARGDVPEVKMGETKNPDLAAASKLFGRFSRMK